MTELPVKKTTRAAWVAAGANFGLLLRLAVLPFVAVLAIDLVSELELAALAESPAGEPGLWHRLLKSAAFHLLLALLGLAVQAAFILQAYRLFLLGRTALKRDGLFYFGPEGRRLFLLLVAVAMLTDVPFRMEGVLLGSPFAWAWNLFVPLLRLISWPVNPGSGIPYGALIFALTFLIYLFAGWALAVRLAFLFPNACLDRPWDIKARWQETKGNGWRLFAALLRVGFLILLVGGYLEGRAGEYPQVIEWFEGIGRGEEMHQALIVLQVMASRICGFSILALWAAVTTVTFAHLTGYPAKGVPLSVANGHPAAAGI